MVDPIEQREEELRWQEKKRRQIYEKAETQGALQLHAELRATAERERKAEENRLSVDAAIKKDKENQT